MVKPPKAINIISELPNFCFESITLYRNYHQVIANAPSGNKEPIICIPGYGGSDFATFFIRKFLGDINYQPFTSDIGPLLDIGKKRMIDMHSAMKFRATMTEKLIRRIESLSQEFNQKITLIGWSMGGLLAYDAAVAIPDKVAQVITLGTPFGDVRGTSIYYLLKNFSKSNDISEDDFNLWTEKSCQIAKKVPIHIIYSQKDGVVSPAITNPQNNDSIIAMEVDSSHIGFVFNKFVFEKIAEILIAHADQRVQFH